MYKNFKPIPQYLMYTRKWLFNLIHILLSLFQKVLKPDMHKPVECGVVAWWRLQKYFQIFLRTRNYFEYTAANHNTVSVPRDYY